MIRVKRNLSRMKSSINFSVKSVTLEKFRFRGSPVTELPWKIRVYTVFHQKIHLVWHFEKSNGKISLFTSENIIQTQNIFARGWMGVSVMCPKIFGDWTYFTHEWVFILDSKWKTKLFILTTFPLVHYDIIILFMTSSGGSFLISTFKFLSFENKNGKIPIPS